MQSSSKCYMLPEPQATGLSSSMLNTVNSRSQKPKNDSTAGLLLFMQRARIQLAVPQLAVSKHAHQLKIDTNRFEISSKADLG